VCGPERYGEHVWRACGMCVCLCVWTWTLWWACLTCVWYVCVCVFVDLNVMVSMSDVRMVCVCMCVWIWMLWWACLMCGMCVCICVWTWTLWWACLTCVRVSACVCTCVLFSGKLFTCCVCQCGVAARQDSQWWVSMWCVCVWAVLFAARALYHAVYIGLARTVYIHRIWPYIWWFPCQNYRM